MKKIYPYAFLAFFFFTYLSHACSVLYYVDSETGKIYVANNEDYWYNVEAYLQIEPKSGSKWAHLWYGWDDFAQGGVNQAGLFFDGAVTPDQQKIKGAKKYKGNLGSDILAECKSVEEALEFLEKQRIGLSDAHMMLGDASGHAVIVEWIDGIKKVIPIEKNRLIMTNYLVSNPEAGNYPCRRYSAIESSITRMESSDRPIDFLSVAKTLEGAVQTPRTDKKGKIGGTLYSTFINITDMEFVLVYKLDNEKIKKLDLDQEFESTHQQRIQLN